MNSRILLLVCLLCTVSGASAAGDYLGGGIQLGGSGARVTVETTVTTLETATAPMPLDTLPATGSLSIATSPAGATIFIDGVQRGFSPATIAGLSPKSHTLLLKLDGYQDLSVPLTVTAGQTKTYTLDLSPLAAAEAAPPAPSKKKTPGFEALLGIAALGAAVLAAKTCR